MRSKIDGTGERKREKRKTNLKIREMTLYTG
jgi:hypothetical protein